MKNTTLERNAYIITVDEYKHKIYMSYERFTFIGQNPFKKFSNATKKDVPLEPMVFIVLSSLVGVRCATLIPPAALRFSLVITKIQSFNSSGLMARSHCTGRGQGTGTGTRQGTMDFYIMLCTVHITQGQEPGMGMGTGTNGLHTHSPLGPVPVLSNRFCCTLFHSWSCSLVGKFFFWLNLNKIVLYL